jgi:hypothetical protein
MKQTEPEFLSPTYLEFKQRENPQLPYPNVDSGSLDSPETRVPGPETPIFSFSSNGNSPKSDASSEPKGLDRDHLRSETVVHGELSDPDHSGNAVVRTDQYSPARDLLTNPLMTDKDSHSKDKAEHEFNSSSTPFSISTQEQKRYLTVPTISLFH